MKKGILIGCGVVILIIIIVLVLGISNLGPIIKTAVNTYGPRITKTEVRLDGADVSIFSGTANLKGLLLGNPTGFKAPKAMSVGSIHVDLDEKSLTGDTIIIDKIEVIRPEITYEKAKGTDNFNAILNNIKQTVGAEKGSKKKEPSSDSGAGKKIIIKDCMIKKGRVNLVMPILAGKDINAPLPDIHLKNIGEKKGGASPAEAFKEIFAALYEKITGPDITNMFNTKLKDLGIDLKSVEDTAKKSLETVTDQIKGGEKGMGSTTDKLKGLLGK